MERFKKKILKQYKGFLWELIDFSHINDVRELISSTQR